MTIADRFAPVLIDKADDAAIRKVREPYETMLVAVLDAILDRYDRTADYPFIDTKLSVITGADFPPAADPARDFRGKGVIYGWIQGRALEALAGHARWLPSCSVLNSTEREERVGRVRRVMAEVMEAMERLRARNGGRLSFMMAPDGRPLRVGEDGRLAPLDAIPEPSNFADLFYAKGLLAAGAYLERPEAVTAATASFRRAMDDVCAERFVPGHQSFDPKNPARAVAGCRGQGPWMIVGGGLALFHEVTGADEWLEAGAEFIAHLVDHHINIGQFPGLEPYDWVEFIDPEGRPWRQEADALSDTGHCLEFVGLALKVLAPMKDRGAHAGLVRRCAEVLPRLFLHNFAIGFDRVHGGIRKSFGLLSRRPLNDDMPWWSLPETMRAAVELAAFVPDSPERPHFVQAFADCSNAFLQHYVNPKAHLMAYQTRNARGEVVDVIPATPDADPGYHTGLSIIDCLKLL